MGVRRIYKFDTLKVLCMMLVVIAHTLNNSYGCKEQEMIRFFCLCYTMPLFTFISGYFSKPDSAFLSSFKRLLIPCIVFTLINNVVMLLVNPHYTFNWRIPGFAMWYLWALFVYRVTLPYLIKIPYIVSISFVVSWMVGFYPVIGVNYSLSRIFCFLPYFLLGYMVANKVSMSPIRQRLLNSNRHILGGGISSSDNDWMRVFDI